jgi:hypothetical protein
LSVIQQTIQLQKEKTLVLTIVIYVSNCCLTLTRIIVNFLVIEESEIHIKHEHSSSEEKIVNIKNKGKNILRLKTKTGEVEYNKNESRKKKKDKKNSKATSKYISNDGKYSLISHFNALSVEQCKEEVIQNKNILKANIKVEEVKDDAKERPLICNCKKSRCLKFY